MIELRTRNRAASLVAAGLLAALAVPVAPLATAGPATTIGWSVDVDVDPTVTDTLAHASTTVVVVRAVAGAELAVRDAAIAGGASLLADLPIINGFAARIDNVALDALTSRDDVVAITADTEAAFHGKKVKSNNGNNPKADSWFEETINADTLHNLGIDGSGVGIAIVDTGVANHPTLTGKVGPGVDVSGAGDGIDDHGHGTFLAGLAVGSGDTSPQGEYDGVAPGAHIIPVKVGDENGVSLIALLQGLQWIHFHKDSHDIDVVNMSFGTSSPQSFTIDPLNFAVQRLWADGIVVVVAAGNLGDGGAQTITKPGDDPFVITVGSTDSMGNKNPNNDTVPAFSSKGPTLADGLNKPDLVAPGRSLAGPVAPDSAVALMTDAHIADGWVRATGTSMSTAIVSGAVALILDANPTWTNDQVKGALMDSAAAGPVGDPNVDGAGQVDVAAAAFVTNPSNRNAGIPFGTGTGSLSATLGDLNDEVFASSQALPATVTILEPVTTCILGICTTVELEVEVPAETLEFYDATRFIADWTAATWADTQWAGNQWWGNQWWGNQWWGNAFYGNQWWGNQWWGNQWLGNQWWGNQWWGNQWLGNQWWGNQWWGNQWLGNEWYGNQWWGNQWWSEDFS